MLEKGFPKGTGVNYNGGPFRDLRRNAENWFGKAALGGRVLMINSMEPLSSNRQNVRASGSLRIASAFQET